MHINPTDFTNINGASIHDIIQYRASAYSLHVTVLAQQFEWKIIKKFNMNAILSYYLVNSDSSTWAA